MMRLEDIKGCGRRKSRIETGGKQVRRMSGTWKRACLLYTSNMVKGAAGQAIQNMNLMFGLPENTGLKQIPIFP